VDNWVNDIAKDMLDVPHLHITLTNDDLLRPFFYADLAVETPPAGYRSGRP
jgi:hypothetical protein